MFDYFKLFWQLNQLPIKSVVIWFVSFLFYGLIIYLFLRFALPIPLYFIIPYETRGESIPGAFQLEYAKKPWWLPINRRIIELNNKGVDSYYKGDSTAVIELQEGIESNKQLSYLHNNLGCALCRNMGSELQLNTARAEFEKAIELDKNDPIPYENLILASLKWHPVNPRIQERSNEALKYETRPRWVEWLTLQRD